MRGMEEKREEGMGENGREERMGVNKKWRIGKKREREEWERIENERNGREERTGGMGEKRESEDLERK